MKKSSTSRTIHLYPFLALRIAYVASYCDIRELKIETFSGGPATGLAEQAWNRGSGRFPPKFEH